ncbi:hypothetical protein CYY_005592 [Polysphondylium violaceum]|uniref:Uncharacterized protein n=1 Tax=Polysphondylium violaceum TaxID=133409 RepID=A0A8J4PRM9_9MYCE|nr:hypothetical protein CYY_005592 [Polysphondylium violaceum]
MRILNFIYLFTFLSLTLCLTQAQTIVQSQFEDLVAVFNLLGHNTSKLTPSSICLERGISCNIDVITGIQLETISENVVIQSNLFIFPNITQLKLSNIIMENQFLLDMSTNCPSINVITCVNCTISQVPYGNYKYGTLYLPENQFEGTHYLSEILPFPIFHNPLNKKQNINWINNFTQPTDRTFAELTLTTSSFPDFTYLRVFSFTIYLTDSFPNGVITNIEKIPKLTALNFYGDLLQQKKNLTFPLSFENYKVGSFPNNKFDFKSSGVNWHIARKLDLSKSEITSFSIDAGFELQDGSKPYPIVKTNPSLLKSITVKNSNINTVDFGFLTKIFSNDISGNQISMAIPNITLYNTDRIAWSIDQDVPGKQRQLIGLNISHNNFYGEVPQWVCNVDADISYNNFTGILPDCYACYLNDQKVRDRIQGNNFQNYQDDLPESFWPSCYAYVRSFFWSKGKTLNSYMLHIQGQTLGINSNITVDFENSTSGAVFKNPIMLKANEWYYFDLIMEPSMVAKIAQENLIRVSLNDVYGHSTSFYLFDGIPSENITYARDYSQLYAQTPFPQDPNPDTSSESNPTTSSTGGNGGSTSTSTASTTDSGTTPEPNSAILICSIDTLMIFLGILIVSL